MKKIFVLLFVAAISVTGCSKKKSVDDDSIPTAAGADENMMGDSDNGQAMGLQTIHFAYDSYLLGAEAKATLKSNAQVLKDKTSLEIQIEGHCDQRGGIQYNIALGEKRANAVKQYMVDMGVSAGRISVISFGKEKPLDYGMSEEAYARNRRANFVVTNR